MRKQHSDKSGLSVRRLARMQVHDCGADARRIYALPGDVLGVTGRQGDMEGVRTAPVIAQLMMAFGTGLCGSGSPRMSQAAWAALRVALLACFQWTIGRPGTGERKNGIRVPIRLPR